MVDQLIFSKKEASFLKALLEEGVDFMIVGLSAATLQGAPLVTQDIDLWFDSLSDPRIQKALKKVGGAYVPPFGLNPPMFVGKAVKLFDIVTSMSGLEDYSKEKENTIEVELLDIRVRVLKLDRIIKSKEAANREKDKLVLPVLRDTLLTLQKS